MVYGLGLAGVAALGIATRQFPGLFPDFVATYGGDALWAVAGFLLIAILLP